MEVLEKKVWVLEDRQQLPGSDAPGILEWLEQQIRAAENAKFSAALRRDQDDVNYWRGYEQALSDLKDLIERREVRA